MKLKVHFKKHSVLIRFLIPYLVFLLAIILVSTLMYVKTIEVVREEIVDRNISVLNQTKEVLEERLSQTEDKARKIVENPKVVSLQYKKDLFSGANVNRLLELKDELGRMEEDNPFILDFFVLYNNSELAISPNSVYRFPDLYSENLLKYEKFNYQSWYDTYIVNYHAKEYIPEQEMKISRRSTNAITYLNSIGYPNYYSGAVVILIDANQIKQMLSRIDISNGGGVYILDENGESITSISKDDQPFSLSEIEKESGFKELTTNGHKMMATYTTSKINGWKFVAIQPNQTVFEKVTYIKKISISVLSIMILLGAVGAYFLAHRNSRPLSSLLSFVKETFESESIQPDETYGFIRSKMSDLKTSNEVLESRIEEQKSFLKGSFIKKLLSGEFDSKQEMQTFMSYIGIHIEGKNYAAVLLHLDEYENSMNAEKLDSLSIKKSKVKEVLEDYHKEGLYFHDIEEDKIIMLLSSEKEKNEDCENDFLQFISIIDEEIYAQYKLRPFIALGSIVQELADIASSYQDSLLALNYQNVKLSKNIISFYEVPCTDTIYYYPIDSEQKLMTTIKAGEHVEVKDHLEQLFRENTENRHLSLSMFAAFIREVHGTYVKAANTIIRSNDHLNSDQIDLPRESHSYEKYADFYDYLKEQFMSLCTVVNHYRKNRNEELKDSILSFILNHFVDYDLSLTMVADHFKLSDIYLSNFLKEQCGITFSDHVSELRMKNARQLLNSSALTVNTIASRVGYNSSNSFCRAFKRVHGVSPTAYRKSGEGTQKRVNG